MVWFTRLTFLFSSGLLNSYLPDVDFFCGHHFESGSDIPLKAFHESVLNDIMAAKGVTDNLNSSQLRQYVKVLDECRGQILISGIGELFEKKQLNTVFMVSTSFKNHKICTFSILYMNSCNIECPWCPWCTLK